MNFKQYILQENQIKQYKVVIIYHGTSVHNDKQDEFGNYEYVHYDETGTDIMYLDANTMQRAKNELIVNLISDEDKIVEEFSGRVNGNKDNTINKIEYGHYEIEYFVIDPNYKYYDQIEDVLYTPFPKNNPHWYSARIALITEPLKTKLKIAMSAQDLDNVIQAQVIKHTIASKQDNIFDDGFIDEIT